MCPGVLNFNDPISGQSITEVCSGHGTCSWQSTESEPKCSCASGWTLGDSKTCDKPTDGLIHVGGKDLDCSLGAYRQGCSQCVLNGICSCKPGYDGPGAGKYGCIGTLFFLLFIL